MNSVASEERVGIGEGARRFGISIDTLRRASDSGRLPCWRGPGGKRFFNPADIRRMFSPEVPEGARCADCRRPAGHDGGRCPSCVSRLGGAA